MSASPAPQVRSARLAGMMPAVIAVAAVAAFATATTDAQQRRPTLASGLGGAQATLAIDPDMQWTRIAGCARDISATDTGSVLVTGCDVGQGGASSVYRWDGAAFVPHPADGRASAIAGFGGNAYAIGSDALLYSSTADGAWQRRGTPNGRPITDVDAGPAGVWIVTSQPEGDGGNALARATPCPTSDDRLLPERDFCGWQALPGAAMRVSVGATAWVVTANRELYRWEAEGGTWSREPGCFVDVDAGGRQVHAVSCTPGNAEGQRVLRRAGDGRWIDTRGAGMRVAVDGSGNVWVVTLSGQIWRGR